MATRMVSVESGVSDSFDVFANKIESQLATLGEIQLISFDVTRKESPRGGSSFRATIMYEDAGGTYYSLYSTSGTPEEVEEKFNEEWRASNLYRRSRFLKTLYTGNARRLGIGLVMVYSLYPYETQVGRQAVLMTRGGDGLVEIQPGETVGMYPVERNGNEVGLAVNVTNIGSIPLKIGGGGLSQIVFRDPSTNDWYMYPSAT